MKPTSFRFNEEDRQKLDELSVILNMNSLLDVIRYCSTYTLIALKGGTKAHMSPQAKDEGPPPVNPPMYFPVQLPEIDMDTPPNVMISNEDEEMQVVTDEYSSEYKNPNFRG